MAHLISRASILLVGIGMMLEGSAGAPQPLRVVDDAGNAVVGATVVCLEGDEEGIRTDQEGIARLEHPCGRVRCETERHLPGETSLEKGSTCVVRRGLVVYGRLRDASCGESCTARLLRDDTELASASVVALEDAPEFVFEAVEPGRVRLDVTDDDGTWRCGTDLGVLGPGARGLIVPWRDPVTVAGTVLADDEQPRAGVRVQVFSGRPREKRPRTQHREEVWEWKCDPVEQTAVETAPDGSFGMIIDPQSETLIVAAGWDAPTGIAARVVGVSPRDEPMVLHTVPPTWVRARVLHEDDEPAACISELRPEDETARWVSEVLPGSDLAIDCDSDGQLVFGPFLSSGYEVVVQPRPGLPLRIRQSSAPGPDGDDLGVLRIDRGESFSVTVSDFHGSPVEQALVEARGSAGIVVSAKGATDAAGEIRLSGLPRHAEIDLSVEAAGFQDEEVLGLTLRNSPYALTLEPAAVVAGRVVTMQGKPVEGAEVTLFVPAETRLGANRELRRTDADGAFRFDATQTGLIQLVAKAAGYRPSESLVLDLVGDARRKDLELAVEPAPEIRGIVIDPDQHPVAGARVGLTVSRYPDVSDRRTWLAGTISDADGQFVLSYEIDEAHSIVATAGGHGPAVRRKSPTLWGEKILLRLTEPARLSVRVPAGLPAEAGVIVRDGARTRRVSRVVGRTELVFENLAPGDASVSLVPGAHETVELIANRTVEVSLSNGATLTGRVTLDGAPVPRASVFATSRDQHPFSCNDFTDDLGRFRLAGLTEGPHLLVAVSEQGRAEREIEVSGKREITVDLDIVPVRLTVQVVESSTDIPVAGAFLNLTPEGADDQHGFPTMTMNMPGHGAHPGKQLSIAGNGGAVGLTGSGGTALLTVREPGRYEVSIGAEDHEPWDETVDLVEGSNSLEVELTPRPEPSERRVEVVLISDPPGLKGQWICDESPDQSGYWGVDERCRSMPPGPAEVVFRARGYGAGSQLFHVPEEGQVRVTVKVPPGGALVIPISDPKAPRPDVRDTSPHWWSPFVVPRPVQEDVPGVGPAWVYRGIPPGTYTAVVGAGQRSGIAIESGKTTVAY